jgi:hypothetical protein
MTKVIASVAVGLLLLLGLAGGSSILRPAKR